MQKHIKIVISILFILSSICIQDFSVSASEIGREKISQKYTDSDCVQVYPMYSVYHVDWLKEDGKKYLFTEKSSGKIISLQIGMDGLLTYCFSSDDVKLLDENKKIIKGKEDRDELGTDYGGVPIRMISVKKDKKYYIQLPKNILRDGCEIYAYVHPRYIEKMEKGKTYYSEGTGKYVYYSFNIKRKSLFGLTTNPIFITDKKMSYRLQKKIKGKWKDIASVRSKLAAVGQSGGLAPYGLSKGSYRLGIKIEKGQIATFDVDVRNVKYRNPTKKNKAVEIKKGKYKENIFTWEDKKAHWYKVCKSDKKNVKQLTVYAGGAVDKFVFSIYKEGVRKPLKTIKIRGKNRTLDFLKYVSKSYALKDNGTYYIKVSKVNKKTNGAYKIGVK